MKTYIHAKGSNIESTSRTDITEILNLLQDNFNEEVSVKDIRDSIFSVWEGCPFKFTNVESNGYIGLSRPESKMKIFLGKRNIDNKNVMSKDLLSSDTDIFLYNTKNDDDDQYLKVSLLSGRDKSLWMKAPYIKSAESNLEINNKSGDISLISNGKIVLNGTEWPNPEEFKSMIDSPDNQSISDLGVYIVDGKHIQFKKSNGPKEMLFTDKNPTQVDIGGIKAGSTFDNVPISEILRQILYPYLEPKIDIEILNSGENSSLERDHTNRTVIEVKYTILRRSENIDNTTVSFRNSKTIFENREIDSIVSDGPSKSEFFDVFRIEPDRVSIDKLNGEFSLMVKSTDSNGSSSEESKIINFVYPYFFGFFEKVNFDTDYVLSSMPSLRKKVDIKCDQNIPVLGDGHFCFMSPSEYGDASFYGKSIPDFEKKTIKNIHSPDKKWGSVEYNVYISKDTISISSMPEIWKISFI